MACRLRPFFRLLCFLPVAMGFVCADVQAQSASSNPAKNLPVVFTQVTIVPDRVQNGVQGIGIAYQLISKSANLVDLSRPMAVVCRLYDENRLPLPSCSGAGRYAGKGHCGDSIVLAPRNTEAATTGDTLFIPYYAMDMDPGPRRIHVALRLMDVQDQMWRGRSDYAMGSIVKPATRLVRIELERMSTFTTNDRGETWDYKFLNANEIYPDLQWSLRRGNDPVFEGEKQKNDTVYLGKDEDRSPWFFISQGDKVQVQVIDFDLLGSSDQIGQLDIDVDKGSFAGGVSYDFSFGQVRNAKLKVDAMVPPRLVVTGFEVVEDEREMGVSGLRLRMEYDQETRNRDCEFRLGVSARTLDQDVPLMYPRIVGPGAIPTEEGQVLLTAAHSKLDLFIPHYSLRGLAADQYKRIRVDLVTQLDGQSLVVGRLERPLMDAVSKVNDILFGQWKLGLHDQEGEGGIRLSIDYELPEGYFRDMPVSKLSFIPHLNAPWGPVSNQDFVVLGMEKVDWQDSVLYLKLQNRKGTLDLFLPYHKCRLAQGKAKIAVDYDCRLDMDRASISLGSRGFDTDLELPELFDLHLAVRETAVRRRQWLLNHPDLYWVLKVGKTEVFRSPVKTSVRHIHWPEELQAHIVAAGTDQIQLLVIDKGVAGEEDRIVETWQTTAAAIPNKPKGNTRLKTSALQRLTIHSQWGE